MIRHTVAFTLKHPRGSREEQAFLRDARALAGIPGVRSFEQLRQVSPKTHFHYGFSMEFDDEDAYEAYNLHPVHTEFVQTRWVPEVADFMEIDYVPV
jgi:heme-degrading monooxygenase HmoA